MEHFSYMLSALPERRYKYWWINIAAVLLAYCLLAFKGCMTGI